MSTIYIQEAVNLFCGDHDPTASNHLTISEMKLPGLNEDYQDFHPGGSRVGIEVETGVQKLVSTFKLAGHNPHVLSLFGLGAKARRKFTSYGVIRDKRSGVAIESKAIMEGRLSKVEAEGFSRGNLQSHDYGINEILHYELWFGGQEKVYWDFFTSEWRIDGVSQNDDERQILRLPTA